MNEVAEKTLLHTRQVTCRGYQLADGRWEIIGQMVDLKSFPIDIPDHGRAIPVGEPLHDISLALVIDRNLIIHQVRATIDAAPYSNCPQITDAFAVLEGMSLAPGFKRLVKNVLGGAKGCTHLLELLGPIATTAYQTLWQSKGGYDSESPEAVDRLIDSCHTFARDGAVVRAFSGLESR